MRILPSRARLAGAGLAIAAFTIIALAVLVLVDLERENVLHHEVIEALQVKDSLQRLRAHLQELRSAARLGARTGDPPAFRVIERRAVEVESELAYLGKRAQAGALLPFFEELARSSRLLVMHARSVAGARSAGGRDSAASLAQEAERLAQEAGGALDRSLDALTRSINERTLAQIRLGEG